MLGYDSWEHLLASSSPQCAVIPTDECLTLEARKGRYVQMALQLARGMQIEFPYAHMLVCEARPLSSKPKEPAAEVGGLASFYEVMAAQHGLWVISSYQDVSHPFVVPGFQLAVATNVAADARRLLRTLSSVSGEFEVVPQAEAWDATTHKQVLLPGPNSAFIKDEGFLKTHVYFRRGDLPEIEWVPGIDLLKDPEPMKARQWQDRWRCFFDARMPELEGSDRDAKQQTFRHHYRRVLEIARLPEQMPGTVMLCLKTRLAAGLTWLWPLVSKDPGSEVDTKAGLWARDQQDIGWHVKGDYEPICGDDSVFVR